MFKVTLKMSKIKVDPFPTTVLPFEYIPAEWDKSPKSHLLDYIIENNLGKYKITHVGDSENGYVSALKLYGHRFTASTVFRTKEKSEENVVILALLNFIGYCETAKELQSLIFSQSQKKISRKLSKSHDSISNNATEIISNENRCDINQEISFLPKLDRLSIIVGQHPQDTNLLMDKFEIDGVIFEADKKKVTVCITDKTILPTLSNKKPIKLGSNCYEIPYKFYDKNMGRACWVFNIGVSEDPVHIHPCKIITNKENFIHLESQFIPEDKSLKDYHNANYHFVVLFPLKSGFYGVYKRNY